MHELSCHRILMKRGCQLSTSVRTLPLTFQGVTDVLSQSSSVFFHGACTCSLCGHCHRALLHSSTSHFRKKTDKKPVSVNPKGIKREKAPTVSVWKNMTVQELADAVGRDLDTLFEIFLYVDDSEIYDSPRTPIDNVKVIQEAVKRAGFRCDFSSNPLRVEKKKENKDAVKRPPPLESELISRPPVVTIMGHVDHGKTTLLDALRHTSVVDTEFGGITQHIGAFAVKLDTGEQVTFLDTPGHAAFKAMRARGANVTDMVVLVVAADDGVMLQTKESIEHAQEAMVPIIIAINKIDKPEANIERCRQMLLDCGLQLEEQGGEVQAVPISALKGQNLDLLIEAIATEAELLNLRADSKGLVEASVVEARTDPGRGKVVTCIIQRGTLRKGAVLVAGTAWGKVRNMFSDSGKPLKDAPPATPVQIIGWRDLPAAGDLILEVESDRRANEVIDWRKQQLSVQKQKEAEIIIQERLNEHLKVYRKQLEERRMQGRRYGKRRGPREKESREEDTGPRVSIVLKGDVDGSVEAILDVIDTYHSPDCQLYVLSYGVGMVTPSDVNMAATFKELTSRVSPDLGNKFKNRNWLRMHAIWVLKNNAVDNANLQLLKQLPGEECSYKAIDIVLDSDEVVNCLEEFLNSLTLSVFWTSTSPLKTQDWQTSNAFEKLGATKALQWNSSCHKKMMPRILEATILTGKASREDVFIPRIPVIPSDAPFEFKCLQFPLKLSFAMSNNKAQVEGQTPTPCTTKVVDLALQAAMEDKPMPQLRETELTSLLFPGDPECWVTPPATFTTGKLNIDCASTQFSDKLPRLPESLVRIEYEARTRLSRSINSATMAEMASLVYQDESLFKILTKSLLLTLQSDAYDFAVARRNCRKHVLSEATIRHEPNKLIKASIWGPDLFPEDIVNSVLGEAARVNQSLKVRWGLMPKRKYETIRKSDKRQEEWPLCIFVVSGEANVLAEFVVTEGKKKIPVAGCRCIKGTLKRDARYRVIRKEEVIHEGELQSMRHLKSEVKSIPKEKECGLMFQDEEVRFELGDTILCYAVNKVKQVTDWDPGF
ncbi:translation initiation factor IF-2, mitochondrial-like [Macrobrachium nipponense]|uniref:translation initiation factor IF-2, mitochondrial-like n=1 Tax=Macrobrachium nipponense TaxID=159736 RepID=UPI0030C87438